MKNQIVKKIFVSLSFLVSAYSLSQTKIDNLVKDAADLYKAENFTGVLRMLENEDTDDYRIEYLRIISKYELLKDYRKALSSAKSEAENYVQKNGSKNSKYTSNVKDIVQKLDLGRKVESVYESEQETSSNLLNSKIQFPPITFADDYPDFRRWNNKLIKIGSPDYSFSENPKQLSEIINSYQRKYNEDFFKGKANFCFYYEIAYDNPSKKGKRLMIDMRTGKVFDVPEAGNRCSNYESEETEFDFKSNFYTVKSCEGGTDEFQLSYLWSESNKRFELVGKKLLQR